MYLLRYPRYVRGWEDLLSLILRFAYMNDCVDPPTSALLLTPEDAEAEMRRLETAFLAYLGERLAGCAFLAIAEIISISANWRSSLQLQRRGIGKGLLSEVERHALQAEKSVIELQTRVELDRKPPDLRAAWALSKRTHVASRLRPPDLAHHAQGARMSVALTDEERAIAGGRDGEGAAHGDAHRRRERQTARRTAPDPDCLGAY